MGLLVGDDRDHLGGDLHRGGLGAAGDIELAPARRRVNAEWPRSQRGHPAGWGGACARRDPARAAEDATSAELASITVVSYPRAVVPGQTYLITRRCSERRFLLRPDDRTTQAFWYCLAEAAELCQIDVCAALALSNHYHAVVHDPHGRYPEFLERFHAMLAKVQNVHWGRWESLWSSEQTSAVDLIQPADAFDKMIYTLTNPVKDHLVEHATEWPGPTSLHHQLSGHPIRTRRPHWFFAQDTKMPLWAEIHFKRLPGFEKLSDEDWAAMITAAIAKVEETARLERLEQRRNRTGSGRVVGCKKLRTQSAFDHPKSHEPRREMSPRVAAKNKWRRVEALRRNQLFLADYRAAFLARRAGDTAVLFPFGAYRLPRHGLALCACAPAPKA